MRGAASCLEVMLAHGANVMSTDGAGAAAPTRRGKWSGDQGPAPARQALLHVLWEEGPHIPRDRGMPASCAQGRRLAGGGPGDGQL